MSTYPRVVPLFRLARAALLLPLAGCGSLADRWAPPEDPVPPPAAFRQAPDDAIMNPSAATSAWWTVFQDPVLDALEERVISHNPELRGAVARLDRSLALLGVNRAETVPNVGGEISATTVRDSSNSLLFPIDSSEYERYDLGLDMSWELDLWGRIRGSTRREEHLFHAESANYDALRLSLQSNLARQYFAFRTAEAEHAILLEAVTVREEALALQESRLRAGAGVELDVARSRVELETARAAAEATGRSLGKLEHAIAILAGAAPSELEAFETAAPVRPPTLPVIPAGIPASLLERRPDLRAATQRLRAVAMEIGLRRVDALPELVLSGKGGLASLESGTLGESDSLYYSLGPQIDFTLFEGGASRAGVQEARARWRETAAEIHHLLLNAVREVDDALLDLKSLEREFEIQQAAVQAATDAARLARLRYERGLVNYFEFVDAERSRLQTRRAENARFGERRAATVRLIRALGGAW